MTTFTIRKFQSKVNNLVLDMCNLQADIERASCKCSSDEECCDAFLCVNRTEACDYDEMLEIAKEEMVALAKRVAERMEEMANAKTTHDRKPCACGGFTRADGTGKHRTTCKRKSTVTFAGVKASVRHLG